jgi:hypothetical protein
MIMSRHPNSGQNQNIRLANDSFEKVAKFKYLGTTLTCQNNIHDEIKRRLNSRNACYYSVQNLLSSPLISQNIQNCNFSGCAVWVRNLVSHFVGEIYTEGFSGGIFGPKMEEDGSWRKLHND